MRSRRTNIRNDKLGNQNDETNPNIERFGMKNIFFTILILILSNFCFGEADFEGLDIFVIEPVEVENICIWVPAEKTVPRINRSCMARGGEFSFNLGASIKHSKDEKCYEGVGRILGEYTSGYYEESLPLTIFNGWQWEYSYNIAEFDKVSFTLERRGGAWENCWEAILNQSCGTVEGRWFNSKEKGIYKSEIEVSNFSYLRVRNGYPKNHKF